MLSLLHKKAYQEFITLLYDWQKNLVSHDSKASEANLSISKHHVEQVVEMKQKFPDLQQFFQQEIMILTEAELDSKVTGLWRSLHTEIQREFRLLSTDILFLASSRQASTRETRLKLINERITKLIAYCQKILDI